MTTLADQVNNGPMSLPNLDVISLQCRKFGAAQATAHQNTDHCVIPPGTQIATHDPVQYLRALFQAQPVAGTPAQLLDALNLANPCRQFRTQKPAVGGFVREPSNRGQSLVDAGGGKRAGFQV